MKGRYWKVGRTCSKKKGNVGIGNEVRSDIEMWQWKEKWFCKWVDEESLKKGDKSGKKELGYIM